MVRITHKQVQWVNWVISTQFRMVSILQWWLIPNEWTVEIWLGLMSVGAEMATGWMCGRDRSFLACTRFFFLFFFLCMSPSCDPKKEPPQLFNTSAHNFSPHWTTFFSRQTCQDLWWKVAETPIELYLWKRRFTQARRKVVVIRLPFDSENPAPIPSIQWEKLESRKRKI